MEFQAIVMAAGTGSRMRDVTSSIPKCLLPIGNAPLILCSLNTLKRAGINEAIVFVRENEKVRVQSAVENKVDLKLDFVTVPKNEDWGTADSLRHIKDKIRSDVLVLSCDVVSDMDLHNMVSFHCSQSSSLTVLLVPALEVLQELDVPGQKKKSKLERDIIGLDPSGRLMFVNSETDFEDGVPLKLGLLKRCPRIKVYSNLVDAHIYMIKRKLVEFITNNKHISTLKGEFLPAAVKKQFSSKDVLHKHDITDISHREHSEKDLPDLSKLSLELSSWNDEFQNNLISDDISCYAYIDKKSLCTRINTLVSYANINRKIAKRFTTLTGLEPRLHPYPKSQLDGDSTIGENCELLTKASVKFSSVGNKAVISEKVKIINCIIFDNVHVGKECYINGSIICSNVIIESNCEIKNSIIGPDQTVMEGTKLQNEILQCTEQLMEI